MAVTVKPKTLSTGGPYSPTGELSPTIWNEGHKIEMASQRMLGRLASGAGEAEELAGMWVEVSRAVADDDTSIDFTGLDSSADEWMVEFTAVKPATDNAYLTARTSTDGGSTYDSSSDYYQLAITAVSDFPVAGTSSINYNGDGQGSLTEIYLPWGAGIDNSSNSSGLCGTLQISNPAAATYTRMGYALSVTDSTAAVYETGSFYRVTADDVNAIRFFMASGNISSGTFVLLKRLK
jgi:hypothetical protein